MLKCLFSSLSPLSIIGSASIILSVLLTGTLSAAEVSGQEKGFASDLKGMHVYTPELWPSQAAVKL